MRSRPLASPSRARHAALAGRGVTRIGVAAAMWFALGTRAHAVPPEATATDGAPPPTSGEPPPPPAGSPGVDPSNPPARAGRTPIEEVTLPCGLVVIAAQDRSLPVAAVVLSIEAGTDDDPPDRPGLVHALAYVLQYGTPVLGPGDAIGGVADVGGWASMAVGAGQVRFESIVPAAMMDRALWIETERLRAPLIEDRLWQRALAAARADRRPAPAAPRHAISAAWARAGRMIDAHDGFRVGTELTSMEIDDVRAQLAQIFDLRGATLVLVSPLPPREAIERVRARVADLPAQPRRRSDRITDAVTLPVDADGVDGGTVRDVAPNEKTTHKFDLYVRAVSGSPRARRIAASICDALGRVPAAPDDPAGSAGRGLWDDDPRRPTMIVQVTGGTESEAVLRARLQRLRDEAGAELLARSAAKRWVAARMQVRSPLGLAIALATSDTRGPASIDAVVTREATELVGVDPMTPRAAGIEGAEAAVVRAQADDLLSLRGWVRVPRATATDKAEGEVKGATPATIGAFSVSGAHGSAPEIARASEPPRGAPR